MKCDLKDFEAVYSLFSNSDLAGETRHKTETLFKTVKYLLSSPGITVLMESETAFVFTFLNKILQEAHLITTNREKSLVYERTRRAAEWLKENTPTEVLVSHIPVDNLATVYYSKKIGMQEMGLIPDGYEKTNGRSDLLVMGCPINTIIRSLQWA